MEIKPLICPQCGGEIKTYSPMATSAECTYCGTNFLIDREHRQPALHYESFELPESTAKPGAIIALLLIGIVGAIFLVAMYNNVKTPPAFVPTAAKSLTPKPAVPAFPTETPNPNLLEFGGKGTGDGLFQDATSVAVDKQGRIYVSDDTLRVQQFSDKGKFIKTIQVPSKTANYERARTIDKIAAGNDGKLYVAVGGVILIYGENSTEPDRTVHVAPDYIQDFALRSDGGILMISDNDRVETLIFANKAGKILRRISGFHTKAMDAALSPNETAIEAIRLAADGAGNIFSIYAFGDLGSFQLSYNKEELMIGRFNVEGKFVNKFVQTMNSCGIAADDQSRLYISDGNALIVYTNTGELVDAIPGFDFINAFALDSNNDVYVLSDDRVVKRSALR